MGGVYSLAGNWLERKMTTRESLLGPPKRQKPQNPTMTKPGATTKRKSRAPAGSRPSLQQKSRPSNATGSRRSSRTSMYGSAPPVKKDPRPLSDKSYQQVSIRRLCAYLAESGYSQEVKPRALQSPSTRDFIHILNFLLGQIDESLMINGFKIDEEVPVVLKQLGYPFNVSKHHLLSVGSPHSWPIILGVLMWLVEGELEDTTSQILFSQGFEFEEEGSNQDEERFVMETEIYKCYMKYGSESEEYQGNLKVIKDSFGQMCQLVLEKLEEMTEMTTQLEQVVEQLSYSSIQSLQASISAMVDNRNAYVDYINNELVPRIKKFEELCQDIEAFSCQTETQITATDERSAKLLEQISEQPMSSDEARKLKQTIKDYRETVAKLRVMADEGSQQRSELQMQHNQSVLSIDRNSREVNDKLRKLAAIVPDAASLPTMDYDGSKRAEPVVLNQLVAQSKLIKQGLQEINQRVAAILSETEAKIINSESVKSQCQSTVTAKQLEKENLEHKVEIETTSLQQKKRKLEGQQKASLTEKHALEKQLMGLQEKLQDDITKKRHHDLMKQFEAERLEMAETSRQITEALQGNIQSLSVYFEACQMKRESVTQQVSCLVEEFQAIKLPSVKAKYVKPKKSTSSHTKKA